MADINPAERSAASALMLGRTGMLNAVYGGTETMRAAEAEFLPQYEKESDARYASRLASTFALNKFREAVDAASAKPFKTLVKVSTATGAIDTELSEIWVPDIDLQGTHLHLFGHDLFNRAMREGQCHFLVDHPTTVDLPNLAVQKEAGARPFFKLITDSQLIAAYDEYIGGDTVVTHCRFQTQRIERTPEYKEIVWNQIWVVEVEPGATAGVVQLYEQEAGKGGNQWTRVGEAPLTMPYVPLVTLYCGDKEGSFASKSIFTDLAYKQIEHWQSSSDQRSILSAARFPMLAASGVQLDEADESGFAIGPYKVLYSPVPEGRWYYVEPKGSAIEMGFKDLEMLEFQMDIMALNPVTGTHRQYVPQNERDIQETRTHSVIHDAALACKDALERGVMLMGLWTGRDFSKVSVDLNTDFSNTKDKLAEVKLLLDAWKEKGISRQTFLREARLRDLFNDDFDIDLELKLLEAADANAFNQEKSLKTGAPTPAPAKVDFEGGGERPTRQI